MTSDWIMVLITLVYVIATIFICRANFKSAKASEEQLKEMRKQFESNNRPYIEVELALEKRIFYAFRFVNNGNVVANNVNIKLDPDFIASLEEPMKDLLIKQEGKKCIIGAHQSYSLYLGKCNFLKGKGISPVNGKIIYFANGKEYEKPFSIDLESYMTIFSVNSDYEDMIEVLKKQNSVLEELKNSVEKLSVNIIRNNDNDNQNIL